MQTDDFLATFGSRVSRGLGWGTHPTSLATEECRDIDFGDISNSESDLREIKLFEIENVKMHFYLLASTGGIFVAMLRQL